MDLDQKFVKLYEGWKKGKYKITDDKGNIIGTYNSGSKAQKVVDDLMQQGKYDKLTVEIIEALVKHECPKCKGEGCEHCDWKGYHIEDEDDDLAGAIVLSPVELDSVGVHDWTVILDFEGLYPAVMCSYNTSHETKVRAGEPHLEDDMVGHRGIRFRKNPMGILPKMVTKLNEQRNAYKAKMAEADAAGDDAGVKKWNTLQLSSKRMRASFYGIMAFDKFSWYDRDIAATITKGGRDALMSIKKKTEELGFKVVFGHTDSIFVTLPGEWDREKVLEESLKLSDILTEHVQTEVRTEYLNVELEAIMDRFFIAGVKNRYAGSLVWTDKKKFRTADYDIDDPDQQWERIKMSGMEAKHTNTAPIGKDVQVHVLKSIWDKVPGTRIQKRVKTLVKRIHNGEVSIEQLTAKGRIGKHLSHHMNWQGLPVECDCGRCPPPKSGDEGKDEDAAYAANHSNNKCGLWYNEFIADEHEKMQKGDTFDWLLAKDGPTAIPKGGWLPFFEHEQVSEYTIDYKALAEKHVVSKLETIFTAMGWDIKKLDPEHRVFMIESYADTPAQY